MFKVNSSYSTFDEVVAAVLQDITDNSMSKGQKARAIYKYAHTKIGICRKTVIHRVHNGRMKHLRH